MDDSRFDSLARSVAGKASRRGVLGSLAGGVAAALGLGPGGDSAEVAAKKGKKCKKGYKKCNGRCIRKSDCCTNGDCTGGYICKNKKCRCPSGTRQCGKKCIAAGTCCKTSDCGPCQTCTGGACVDGCAAGQTCEENACVCTEESCEGCCDGDTCLADAKLCGETCIPDEDCCTSADCTADPDQPFCDGGQCVCGAGGETCESGDICCTGVCTCEGGKPSNPEDGACQSATFAQSFAQNVDGWFDWDNAADEWPGGSTTLTQVDDHAVLTPGVAYPPSDELTPMTLWGGYSNVFPDGGYDTELEIFLDPTDVPDSTHFDYTSAINGTGCGYHTEGIFHAGTDAEGDFCVSAGGGSDASVNPCDNAWAPIVSLEAADAGWYTFRHEFRVNGTNNVEITMTLIDPEGDQAGEWVVEGSTDPAGGNRYGWFSVNQFAALQIRNSSRTPVGVGRSAQSNKQKGRKKKR